MDSFYYPGHVEHDPGVLPQPPGASPNYYSEAAERGLLLAAAVETAGLGPLLAPSDSGLEPILAVHTAELVDLLRYAFVRMAAAAGREMVVIPETFAVGRGRGRASRSIWAQIGDHCYDTSSPIFAGTWNAVYWAAQAALSAARCVHEGDGAAYALCRPPGHHAAADLYGGFCYLNNAAIAADWLARQGRRPAILDVDYHHGNGTQAIFYARNDVFVCSLHADPEADYPFYWGFADERGIDAGFGCNRNLPLPLGVEEDEYLKALAEALREIGRFGADVLVVSLGVDTYIGDPVASFRLQTDSYRRMAERIAALHLPTVIVQEGGYARESLGANVTAFLAPFA